jgi:hypothetical protein
MSELFKIDFEENNLNDFTGGVSDADGHLTVTAGAAMGGSNYGMNCNIADTNTMFGKSPVFDPPTVLRFRFYYDPNTATFSDYASTVMIQRRGGDWAYWVEVKVTSDLVLLNVEGDTGQIYTGSKSITDAPHYIEINIVRATTDISSDGTVQWWVDGVSVASVNGKDNYNEMLDYTHELRWGILYPVAGTTGNVFLDEFVANNDGSEIGPLGGGSDISVNISPEAGTSRATGVRVYP